MSSNPLHLVKLKRKMLTYTSQLQLAADVQQHIESQGDLSELRRHPEFILWVCKLIECRAYGYKGQERLDKKQLVKTIVFRLFPELNNLQDAEAMDTMIQFLYDSKRITQVSTFARISSCVGGYLVKKLL